MNLTAGGAQANSTPRSNPAGDARLPDFERMFGSTQDPASFNQFMQNPAVSQMMQSLLSNPQYMEQVSTALCGVIYFIICDLTVHCLNI